MDTESYDTSDIALASFLLCSGGRLVETKRDHPRRCVFSFTLPNDDLLVKWQGGKATVNALAFYNAYQRLKGEVFRECKGGN